MKRRTREHGVGGAPLGLRRAGNTGAALDVLFLLLLVLGCPPKTQITHYPEVPKVAPVPKSTQESLLECRIDLVVRPPPSATPVGLVTVPAKTGPDVVLDEDARRQACALGATHGVREQAFVDRTGALQQSVRLYRDAPGVVEGLDTQGEVQGSEGAKGGGQSQVEDPTVDGDPRPDINRSRKVDP